MRPRVLPAFTLACVVALDCLPATSSWNVAWSSRSSVRLPVSLPFPSHESLSPGDTRELRIYNQALADLLDTADSKYEGLFAQLLALPPADDAGHAAEDGRIHSVTWTASNAVQTQVAAWLPLLHVMEIRDPWQLHDGTDIDEDPILMWAEVRCIGRVMLQGDGHVVTLRSSSDENVQTTLVAPYGDSALNATQRSAADALILEAEKLRRACFERETLLRLRQHGELPKGPASESERRLRETERRARAEPPAELSVESLNERMDASRAILQHQGLDDAPATSLKHLQSLWNVRSEREAWLQLASYAACSWLRPAARMDALQSRSTIARLQLVCRAFRIEEKTQRAKLALQQLEREQRGETSEPE